MDDAFAKVRKAVGVAKEGPDAVVFHTLRYTAISWMVQDDVPDRDIMKQAGNGSRRILDLYAHLRPGASDRAASALEKRFSLAEKKAESI